MTHKIMYSCGYSLENMSIVTCMGYNWEFIESKIFKTTNRPKLQVKNNSIGGKRREKNIGMSQRVVEML